ncbi:MAG: hypothetical protein MUF54_04280 [Polyangiaceae bacterium]|jgi:hypothetical protein|nr:hypothetical protein [Polyangiaceae bacterium]
MPALTSDPNPVPELKTLALRQTEESPRTVTLSARRADAAPSFVRARRRPRREERGGAVRAAFIDEGSSCVLAGATAARVGATGTAPGTGAFARVCALGKPLPPASLIASLENKSAVPWRSAPQHSTRRDPERLPRHLTVLATIASADAAPRDLSLLCSRIDTRRATERDGRPPGEPRTGTSP